MKILKLTAENIKKLRVVEITPAGEIVTIAGKNAQGKTSVLDSIWLALDHTKVGAKMPLRRGQQKGKVRLELGETGIGSGLAALTVERRFTENGSSLVVESADGARFATPQTMLDALLGELSFDPLAFARMAPREQFDELRRIVHLEVDIDHLDAMNRGDFAGRAEINRSARMKRAQAEAIHIADGLPEMPANEDLILADIQNAAEKNSQIEKSKDRRLRAQNQVTLTESAAQNARDQAARLRAEADQCDREAAEFDTKAAAQRQEIAALEPLPEPADLSVLREQLEQARSVNRLITVRQRRRDLEQDAALLEQQSQEITDRMEARAKTKVDVITAAKMPVAGLGFGEGFVLYNDIPFEQASSSEQLRVSLSIAMAANDKLRVIRIQDGSLLDTESLAQIATMAKEHDYQVWIETVSDDGKVGIVIEDGMVKSTPESRAR
jgi:hypothetical protein